MFVLLSREKKIALARLGLGILGIKYGGRVRTNEPDIYSLFVEFFGVSTQEQIMPILQEIMSMDQDRATQIATSVSHYNKDVFRKFLLSNINQRDGQTMLAVALTLKNIGF